MRKAWLFAWVLASTWGCRTPGGPSQLLDEELTNDLPELAPHLLNEKIDVLNYDVQLDFPSMTAIDLSATAVIQVRLKADAAFIDLHMERTSLEILRTRVAGEDLPFAIIDGEAGNHGLSGTVLRVPFREELPAESLVEVEVQYAIKAASLAHNRGMQFNGDYFGAPIFNTRNWPYYLRYWLPSNDHPGDTATFSFDLRVPDNVVAAANGRLTKGTYGEGTAWEDNRRRFVWRQDTPIPTYGVSVTVADLEIHQDEICFGGDDLDEGRMDCENATSKIPFIYYLARNHPERSRFLSQAEKGKNALVFFSKMLGNYAYNKLGLVNAPHPFNMESVAMIVMISPDATVHEVAHHWWGNTVYIKHWGDFWISEGFTTYFTGLYDEHFDGTNTSCRQTEGQLANPPTTDPMEIFDSTAYCMGAAAIFALREEVKAMIPVADQAALEQRAFYALMAHLYKSFEFRKLGSDDLSRFLRESLASVLSDLNITVSQAEVDRRISTWTTQWLTTVVEPG